MFDIIFGSGEQKSLFRSIAFFGFSYFTLITLKETKKNEKIHKEF